MNHSIRLFTIGRVPVSVDWGMGLTGLIFAVGLVIRVLPQFDPGARLTARLIVATVVVVVFVACVLAHEAGHALAARRGGMEVLGIVLSIYGGSAILAGHPDRPATEARIALAGPAANGVLFAGFALAAAGLSNSDLDQPLLFGGLVWLAGVNFLLAVLNLIPIAPLDGGRVLTALLWWRRGDGESARILTGRVGLVAAGLMVVVTAALGFRYPLEAVVIAAVAIFVAIGAGEQIDGAFVRRRLDSTLMGTIASDLTPVPAGTTIHQLIDQAGFDVMGRVIPVHGHGPEPIAFLPMAAAAALDEAERSWTFVEQVAVRAGEADRAWSNESVATVLDRIGHDRPLTVVVHDPETGREVGTVGSAETVTLYDRPDRWGRRPNPDRGRFGAV